MKYPKVCGGVNPMKYKNLDVLRAWDIKKIVNKFGEYQNNWISSKTLWATLVKKDV